MTFRAPAAAAGTGELRATVASAAGTPIAGATIRLIGSGGRYGFTSDERGQFGGSVAAGTYVLSAHAAKYMPISAATVFVAADLVTAIDLTMTLSQASSIGVLDRVTVNGAEAVSTSPSHVVAVNARLAAEQGVTRVTDMLGDELSTTIVPVAGGGFNAPAAVALRGPDPSETLVEIDGHQVNNGNAGSFDVSLLDPADLQSVQIAYGIAPTSLFGPDTLGGAVNIQTLEPTQTAQSLLRVSAGSFGTFGQTAQTTGTSGDVGYAVSIHRITSAGEIHDFPIVADGADGVVGDGSDATSSIVKLRYGLDRGAGFIGVSLRDQAVYRDLSAVLTSLGSSVQSGAGSALLGHNSAYGFDAQVPLGDAAADGTGQTTALFRHLTSVVAQSSEGPAQTASPFLYNDRDVINDDTLEITHPLDRGVVTIKFAQASEQLATDYVPGSVSSDIVLAPPTIDVARPADSPSPGSAADPGTFGQASHSVGALYTWDATAKLHYSLAAYLSDYSTFGKSFDPRTGFVWTPNPASALRASIGTTFQSPQLPSLYVPPVLPPPVNGYISIGNPHLGPDRATEYDLGYDHFFTAPRGSPSISFDVYRSDLRNAITTFIPPTTCPAPPTGPPPCLSYPVNAAAQVYTGAETHASVPLAGDVSLRAGYGVDSVYLTQVPPFAQDGSLVVGEQTLGVPLHKATLSVEKDPHAALAWYARVLYEGEYNELNRPPFATIQAGATWHRRDLDVGLYGTNLTNVYDDRFTQLNGGLPYGGLTGPIPTDALPLAGRVVIFALTLHSQ
ncbi:MAG TPA: TonB-dependent receptor [Candidatus Eremiobacteraceae bacterium]|nr:TonB-dependent receptor [Candidatus Eremiobacteraceae bacterium]